MKYAFEKQRTRVSAFHKIVNTHIEQALYNFRLQNGRYARYARYYSGKHDLKFATEKFENTFGTLFAALETRTLITIVSAIVLPIIFFAIGKTADVLLQIYLDKRRHRDG